MFRIEEVRLGSLVRTRSGRRARYVGELVVNGEFSHMFLVDGYDFPFCFNNDGEFYGDSESQFDLLMDVAV
jgi:hypothetical protein